VSDLRFEEAYDDAHYDAPEAGHRGEPHVGHLVYGQVVEANL
jgi:hypothetical protein